MNTLENNLIVLNDISLLEKNWNHNNAPAFSSELIQRVKRIIKKLKNQPDIFPTAEESIQLEYTNNNGDYLEYEIFEDGHIQKFFSDYFDNDYSVYNIKEEDINDEEISNFLNSGKNNEN